MFDLSTVSHAHNLRETSDVKTSLTCEERPGQCQRAHTSDDVSQWSLQQMELTDDLMSFDGAAAVWIHM